MGPNIFTGHPDANQRVATDPTVHRQDNVNVHLTALRHPCVRYAANVVEYSHKSFNRYNPFNVGAVTPVCAEETV